MNMSVGMTRNAGKDKGDSEDRGGVAGKVNVNVHPPRAAAAVFALMRSSDGSGVSSSATRPPGTADRSAWEMTASELT